MFNIMEGKSVSSKFTLQTETKYKHTKIQTCLQSLLPWGMLKIYCAKVSYCQNSDIREVSIALVW